MVVVYCLLCLITSLLLPAHINSVTYYVKSDDKSSISNDTFTLQYYIDNAEEYFSLNNELCFLPGVYRLSTTLLLKDVNNFTLCGINNSTIMCTGDQSIMIVNVTNFTMKNINFIGCGNYHTHYVQSKYKNLTDLDTLMRTAGYSASVFIDHSELITINNVSIMADKGFAGLLVINVIKYLVFTNIKIQVNCSVCLPGHDHLNGIVFYFFEHLKTNYKPYVSITIDNLQYKTLGLCLCFTHYAIKLLFQCCSPILFSIQNTTFCGLSNSSLLYYYDRKCLSEVKNQLFIKDIKICNNVGRRRNSMVYIKLGKVIDFKEYSIFQRNDHRQSIISFRNCQFINNTNIGAIIFISPTRTETITGYIDVQQGRFCNNTDIRFIEIRGEAEAFWQLNTYTKIKNFTITLNKHHDGDSLISIIGGIIIIEGPTLFTKNGYYQNIIKIHLSLIIFKKHITIANNHARHIISGNSGSYMLVTEYTTVNVSHNTVYMVAKYVRAFGENRQIICPIQFYSKRGNLDRNPFAFNCSILLVNNIFMMSKSLPGRDSSFKNCQWLGGSAFQIVKPIKVYLNIITISNIIISKTDKRMIPLSVCPCTNSINYNCFTPNLGSLFPGQTLSIKFIVSWEWINWVATTLVVANTLDDDCSVLDSYQLSQTHLNHDCNTYKYTIWPSHESVTECTLFVGLEGMPEMFYIDIKPCPKGFTQQQHKKACSCDPLLDNNIVSITSCNLDDESILRPANSWISAETVNYSHTYQIGSQCPFDYCLPYSSYLNLSDRDTQCQFKRSGILCGQCQQGYSSVFGSSQCMQCSHVYLFIVVPIAIVGVVLVMLLFIFNLTITNGAINSFIFYVNIISINYSLFYPKCHSLDYILLSLFNLDLGIETCFYNGMDDYARILLQLAFPFYLILIAFVLIIGSRYSAKIQKLTARRALPVLSTLFLLSYTKILLTVCQVLFRYTTVTQYPSKDSKLVWLVDISVSLFGIRFLMAFFICLIVFLILLLFNILLLFTRRLLCIKVINSFKPLLDAYFGPYKDRYYYWTGLQLLVRALFLGLSALSRQINLTSGIIVLGVLLCIQGSVRPFKSRYKNYQELFLILNLQAVHTIALHSNFNDRVDLLIVRILIMIAQVYIVIYVTCHCVFSVPLCYEKAAIIRNKICNIMRQQAWAKKRCDRVIVNEMNRINHSDASGNYHKFQEPLIGLDD